MSAVFWSWVCLVCPPTPAALDLEREVKYNAGIGPWADKGHAVLLMGGAVNVVIYLISQDSRA